MATNKIISYANDITYTTAIVAVTCGCGLVYGLAEEFIAARRKDRRSFYCPNGCSRWYPGKTEEQELKEQLEASRSLAQREARRREAAERSARAYKGQATKLRNHAAAGECPAGCGKSYKRLASHMAAKHPGFAEEALTADERSYGATRGAT